MINLVIATYAGHSEKFASNPYKDKYLKYNLFLLNKIRTNVDQITIMKPNVNQGQLVMKDYYNFDNINIENIKHKIKIYECENIGISYGQFITAIQIDPAFDYYIFVEDDYFIFKDNFEDDFIKNMQTTENEFLCLYKNKNLLWNIFNEIKNKESKTTHDTLVRTAKSYPQLFRNSACPDFSIGIISQNSVKKLIKSFGTFEHLIDILKINFRCICVYQILFGYILTIAGIKITDLNEKYLNLFYETSLNLIKILNDTRVDLPLFVPVDIFFYHDMKNLTSYIKKLLSRNDYVQFEYRIKWFYSEIHKIK